MKKILMILCGAIIFLNSCQKGGSDTVAGSNSMLLAYPLPIAAVPNFNTLSSGLNYFDRALLPITLSKTVDSVFLSANIGAPASQDLTVNIGVDQGAFDAYNANTSNIVKYAAMPATYYNIVVNSVTIKAGQTNAKFKIAFYSSLFDISQTGYLLPISITNDPGYPVNSNMKTAYLHIEKDPFPPYSRANWVVTGFSSQETVGEGATNGRVIQMLDNDPNTYWHSQWQNALPAVKVPPHWFSFDMGTANVLHGLMFLDRQSGNIVNKPKDVVVSTSTDNVTWTQAASFTLAQTTAWQKIAFSSPTPAVRYFKVTINTLYDAQGTTNLAELKAY